MSSVRSDGGRSLPVIGDVVTALFDEVIELPLPLATGRRTICELTYDHWLGQQTADISTEPRDLSHTRTTSNPISCNINSSYLDQFADRMAGQPFINISTSLQIELNNSMGIDEGFPVALGENDCLVVTNDEEMGRVFGHESIKQALIEALVWPVQYSALFSEFSKGTITPESSGLRDMASSNDVGILLFGPPGEGANIVCACLAVTERGLNTAFLIQFVLMLFYGSALFSYI